MEVCERLLSACITDPIEAGRLCGFDPEKTRSLVDIAAQYPIRIPPYYLSLIDPEDPKDPIRRLCLPGEMEGSHTGKKDTSGEESNTVVQGMQHKYGPTALILTTNQCAMYCRHCFRKRMVGSDAHEIARNLDRMVEYVKAHPEIDNILLSGGDALVNSNEQIRRYLEAFAPLQQLRYIRIGSRIPVVLPQRITEDGDLLAILREVSKKKQIILVTHFNHPREITEASAAAIRALLEAGCPVRNQTVLLRGVNDDASVLADLMERLVSIGVLPYYLFQCRPARGVMDQFQVPLLTGQQIVDQARARMSGQGKMFRYVMSHVTGKIEILGCPSGENRMLFKYHQAKNPANANRFFSVDLSGEERWLPDIIG